MVLRHWIQEAIFDVLKWLRAVVTLAVGYSDSEDDGNKSETEIREQANFTERLGTTEWCKCVKCTPMPSGIECQCCREMDELEERLMKYSRDSLMCITDHEQFNMVCLNNNVLYTAMVTMKMVRGDSLRLPLYNSYRLIAAFYIDN